MQFNFKDWSRERAIQERVDLEDTVRWAQAPNTLTIPKYDPDEFAHNTPKKFARHWIRTLIPLP